MNEVYLTRDESREIDRRASEQLSIPSMVLMENAGRGVVDVLVERDPHVAEVAILCGKGNNAGDGFVIARHLEIRGVDAIALLLAPPEELGGDAQANYQILTHTNVPIVDVSEASDLPAALDKHAGDAAWLVDAMLGTGAKGAPRPPMDAAVQWMNGKAAKRLAVDIPSGLDCDTGEAAEPCVRADVTCTFVARKTGFQNPAAAEFLGDVHVVSIGTPPELLAEFAAD